MSDAQGADTVDIDDVGQFRQGGFCERDRDTVGLADIVDEDGHLFILEEFRKRFVVGVGSSGEID